MSAGQTYLKVVSSQPFNCVVRITMLSKDIIGAVNSVVRLLLFTIPLLHDTGLLLRAGICENDETEESPGPTNYSKCNEHRIHAGLLGVAGFAASSATAVAAETLGSFGIKSTIISAIRSGESLK